MAVRMNVTAQRSRWRRTAGIMLGLATAAVVVWLARGGSPSKAIGSGLEREAVEKQTPGVTVVRPRAGGIARTIEQPAIMHAFESVDLYAMISGYLKSQAVDIGSIIKKGDVLAEINVPRHAKDFEEARALVAQARAQINQSEARIKVARAQREAAAALEKVAEADLERLTARRQFAEKQYARSMGSLPNAPPPNCWRTSRRAIWRRRSLPSELVRLRF